MKSYTDLEQSKKLAEILPIESADMHYNNASIKGINYVDEYRAELMDYNTALKVLSKYSINPLFGIIPCWSLVSLLDIIKIDYKLEKSLFDQSDYFTYAVYDSDEPKFRTYEYDEPIDALFEMILKLREKDLL